MYTLLLFLIIFCLGFFVFDSTFMRVVVVLCAIFWPWIVLIILLAITAYKFSKAFISVGVIVAIIALIVLVVKFII